MKEIEVLLNPEEGSLYDEELGYYKVISSGLDDIVVIKNYRYKIIRKSDVMSLGNKADYVVVEAENCENYIVKPLDTLNSIAKKYNKSEEYLLNKNNLKTDKLFIGQILKI